MRRRWSAQGFNGGPGHWWRRLWSIWGFTHGLDHKVTMTDACAIVSHRGTLDPCAFWQSFGNSRESFFEMTGTTFDEHYRRYDLVVHLECASVRVPEAYVRYPHAHRPEDIEQAVQLDHLLGELRCGHPKYVKIEGMVDVEEKLLRAVELIRLCRDFQAPSRRAGWGPTGTLLPVTSLPISFTIRVRRMGSATLHRRPNCLAATGSFGIELIRLKIAITLSHCASEP
ncbi:MAG: hypothetical protein NTY19_26680 [Planctomycetota bacterium]|nr:hypothetical protein [Planctomycetota bacterium]